MYKFKNNIKYIKNFGIKIKILSVLTRIFNKIPMLEKVNIKLYNKKHEEIIKYLNKNYSYIIQKYDNKQTYKIKSDKVWIFWWQGIENAPQIVKKCINSIKNFSDNVIIITKDNIFDFIDIENYILEKFNKNIITKTHFSDILRMKLLSKYGGYWIDATVFISDNIFKDIMGKQFYTPKLYEKENLKMVSKGKWCGFFIGGENVKLFNFVNEFFREYWRKEELLIDYFLIDYVINIAYENIKDIKEEIDNNEYNNENIFKLNTILDKKYDKNVLIELYNKNKIHKLSYKDKINIEQKDTFYNKIFC